MTRFGSHDEMVDGTGGLRPGWRPLLDRLGVLGHDVLAERARILDRVAVEEGVSGLLPGAEPPGWRHDPIPLPLPAAEFAALETGLAQRAEVLEALLADVYGPQHLLAEGWLPPALVYANPAFLRACRTVLAGPPRPPPRRLHLYAAELVRAADGAWRVLADRTSDAAGLGYTLENRRVLSRGLPELFHGQRLRPLRPFFSAWRDRLEALAGGQTGGGEAGGGIGLLTPGPADKLWFEHLVLARELSCDLVEAGDLTVRDGALFLKTLRGLKRLRVLLRRQDGRTLDPLELEPGAAGIPGLLSVARGGGVGIVNDPGAGFAEAPAVRALLPALARRLIGADLRLPSVPCVWLGDGAASPVGEGADLSRWRVHPALDGTKAGLPMEAMPAAARARLLARMRRWPEEFVLAAMMAPSAAPCVTQAGIMPRPVVLRMFLLFDGTRWRALPGGLARVVSEQDALAGRLRLHTLSKDVWVTQEDEDAAVAAPPPVPPRPAPRVAIRRASGDLPSRVADNFFWLGRYLERFEGLSRLLRAALTRMERPAPTPRELADLRAVAACLAEAGLVDADAAGMARLGGTEPLVAALLAAMAEGGKLPELLAAMAQLTEALRDRLTGEMHATLGGAIRELREVVARAAEGRAGGQAPQAARLEVLRLAAARATLLTAAISGLVAENMVRGGGRLFLDLGRRIERGRSIAATLAASLDPPGGGPGPALPEPGLQLTLELCDSVMTYHGRYLTLLQPGPVLDLVVADTGNPRALAFQLAAVRDALADVAGTQDAPSPLPDEAAALLEETQAIARAVIEVPGDDAAALAAAPGRLRAMHAALGALSDRIGRRYFTLLPTAHSVGAAAEATRLRGAA